MEALTVQAYLLPSSQKFRNMQNLLLVPRANVNDKTHLLVLQLYKLQGTVPCHLNRAACLYEERGKQTKEMQTYQWNFCLNIGTC